MKKHFLQPRGQKVRPHYPFWQPWGCLGCLGRTLGFAVCLAAFILLLGLLTSVPRCGRDRTADPGEKPENGQYYPMDSIPDDVPDNRVPGPQPVDRAPLPFVPDPDDIVDSPDSVGRIDARHLFVIVDEGNSPAGPDRPLDRFVREFKALYPDCQVEKVNPHTKMVLLAVPAERREQIRRELPQRITDVAFHVDVVEIFGDVSAPSDPALKDPAASWHLHETLAPQGWEVTTGVPEVKVAVIDDYFDLTHPEFTGLRVEGAVSVEKGNSDVLPPSGGLENAHGTHVLGLMGAQPNGFGTVGVAPGCTYMPISLGNAMNTFSIIESVLYALNNGANVINASLGFLANADLTPQQQIEIWERSRKRLQSAWDYVSDMLDRGYCTIVWASGNENLFELMDFAKRSPTVIRVDAVDSKLRKAAFSNFGNVDVNTADGRVQLRASQISAPGVDVVSTVPGRRYAAFGGTSMAAPIVTGAVALMKSLDPTLRNGDIIEILNSTGKKLSNDSIGPLLQIRPALDRVRQQRTGWDEFRRDPTRGLLKKVEQTRYVDAMTGEFQYYAHDYMEFDTRDAGKFEVHQVGADRIYNARFNVTWGDNEAEVVIVPPLLAPDSPIGITTRRIRLFRDKDGEVGWQALEPKQADPAKARQLRKDDRTNTNRRPL